MRRLFLSFVLTALVALAAACGSDETDRGPDGGEQGDSAAPATQASPADGQSSRRLRITVGDTSLTAELFDDNAAADDLLSRLPLTLRASDLGGAEKIAPLPSKLSTTGLPEGDDPSVGDLGYWTPDDNLVFYYGDVRYWDGIVRIGRLNGDLAALARQPDGARVTVRVAR